MLHATQMAFTIASPRR